MATTTNAPTVEQLQKRIAELTKIIGEDYEPCEGCGDKSLMELRRENEALKLQIAGKGFAPVVAVPDPGAGLKWTTEGPYFYAGGKLISKSHFIDLIQGKKLNRATLDKKCSMDHLLSPDGSPSKEAVSALQDWCIEHLVIEDTRPVVKKKGE
jgi:hypothetical protein